MDTYEATRIVYSRIQGLEPQSASKIIGYLLLQDNGDRDMIRLAFAPDSLLQALIARAKKELGLDLLPWSSRKIGFDSAQILPYGGAFPQGLHWDFGSAAENQIPGYFSSGNGSGVGRSCLYFARGYCKHGSSCRFVHSNNNGGEATAAIVAAAAAVEVEAEDPAVVGNLEKLEMEILELLKAKRGAPISIAALPQLYYETYGKTLQAEGYLTESQRHGKIGYSLTKLLARLKNSVRLIDRPHGQHAVVLAEDVAKYTERTDVGATPPSISGSRQIYLTFPAESTFTEEDVSNYFRTYGPVQDVRIPYQQKRMFGFVTFVYPETVKTILAKGNPHYVCGARVLVKPYKEKGKQGDRRITEKPEYPSYNPAVYKLDFLYDFQLGPNRMMGAGTDLTRRQQLILEEHEQALELQRRRLAQLHLANQVSKLSTTTSKFSWLNLKDSPRKTEAQDADVDANANGSTEDVNDFSLTDHFSYLLEVLNSDSIGGGGSEKPKADEQGSCSNQIHNLPDSPFTTPRASYGASNIPAAI